MPRPVFSVSFFQLQGISGSVSYPVPSGFVAVVRDIDAYHGSTATPATMHIKGANAQTFAFWSTGAAFTGGGFTWRGRFVTPSGSSFTVDTDDPFDVTVSGYLLTVP